MSADSSNRRHARTRSLEQAASTIFVLTALLPLLIFVWIIYLLNAMHDARVQVGLLLSLFISMLGFAILRTTMRRTSELLRLLVRAETEVATTPPPATANAADRAEPASPDRHAPPAPESPAHHAHSPHQPAASAKAAASVDVAPAIGAIQELREAADAVIRRWRREAEALLGRPVVVSVANLDEPEHGILARVSETGLVLEQDGQEFGVMWRLVTSVSLDPALEAVTEPKSSPTA